MLNQTDKITLLKFARAILTESVKDVSLRYHLDWAKKLSAGFSISNNFKTGVFVTLTKFGNLRGCVGTVLAEYPLLTAVAKTALQSAFEDPRFSFLNGSELSEIEIEISVLSPMEKVQNADSIIPNVHGVYIKKGFNTGLFLPQVWELIPEKENFLRELCFSKAGISPEAWKNPQTEIYIFTVDHFSEKDFGLYPHPLS